MRTRDKDLLIFIAALFLTSQGLAQLPDLIPFQRNGKFGFSDSTKKVFIEPEYEKVYPFYDGLSRVRKDRMFGFIDKKGDVVIPIKYRYAEDFCLGYTRVGKSENDAFGIDTKGNKATLHPHFDLLRKNRDQLHVDELAVRNDYSLYGLMDKNGKILIDYSYRKLSHTANGYLIGYTWEGDYTFINKKGAVLFEPRKGKHGNDFNEGLCSFESSDKQERGFMDTTGNVVFYLDNVIKYNPGFEEYGMFDPIDKKGLFFSEGKLAISNEGKYGFIDKEGKISIPYKYDRVWNFKDGFAKVKINGKYGFINHQGLEVVEIKYDEVNHFYEGLAFVKMGNKCGYVDSTGAVVIPIELDHWQFEQFYNFKEGKALFKNQQYFGVIDKHGKVLINPIYDEIQMVSGDRAIVKLNAEMGLVDFSGHIYLPVEYKYIGDASSGIFRLAKDDRQALYDKFGTEIFPFKFSRIEPGFFGPDLFIGSIPGNYSGRYYIDKYGTEYKE